MKFSTVKEFPFSMETVWKALQDPAKLDVEPGTEVRIISPTKWEAINDDVGSVSTYWATFDEENKIVKIESTSNKKHDHDFIYFKLKELSDNEVSLEMDVEINTGVHLIAKALSKLIEKPTKNIMSKHVYHNFEALCLGKETKKMTQEELKAAAQKEYEKK